MDYSAAVPLSVPTKNDTHTPISDVLRRTTWTLRKWPRGFEQSPVWKRAFACSRQLKTPDGLLPRRRLALRLLVTDLGEAWPLPLVRLDATSTNLIAGLWVIKRA